MAEPRWAVPSAERLEELLHAALPWGLTSGPPERTFHRDLYFDTPEGELRRRGVSCRVQFDVADRRWLTLAVRDATVRHYETPVAELEPRDILLGSAEPARRLRALVDPDRLMLRIELDVERRLRRARWPAGPG